MAELLDNVPNSILPFCNPAILQFNDPLTSSVVVAYRSDTAGILTARTTGTS